MERESLPRSEKSVIKYSPMSFKAAIFFFFFYKRPKAQDALFHTMKVDDHSFQGPKMTKNTIKCHKVGHTINSIYSRLNLLEPFFRENRPIILIFIQILAFGFKSHLQFHMFKPAVCDKCENFCLQTVRNATHSTVQKNEEKKKLPTNF